MTFLVLFFGTVSVGLAVLLLLAVERNSELTDALVRIRAVALAARAIHPAFDAIADVVEGTVDTRTPGQR